MVRSKLSFHSLRLHDNRTVDTIFDLVEFSHYPKSPQIFSLTLGAYLVSKLFEYQFRNETPENNNRSERSTSPPPISQFMTYYVIFGTGSGVFYFHFYDHHEL